VYRVFDQHSLTKEEWQEKVVNWHMEHKGLMRYKQSFNTCEFTVVDHMAATSGTTQQRLNVSCPAAVYFPAVVHTDGWQ